MKNNTIKIFEVLPMDLRPSFYNLCNEENKTMLKEYIDVMKNEYILEKQDKIIPINEDNTFEMYKVGYLCESCLANVDVFKNCLKRYEIGFVSLSRLEESLENKVDNPVIKEMRNLVINIKDVITSNIAIEDGLNKIRIIYREYKENLFKIPFEENKIDYVEAGVNLSIGNFAFTSMEKEDVRFIFPLFLAETYRNIEPDRHRNDDVRAGYLFPLDSCSKNDYIEIDSKINLNFSNEKQENIEQFLDVTKYDKIKYELDNQKVEKEDKYSKYNDWDEIKEEYQESQKKYDDYYDSNDSCE